MKDYFRKLWARVCISVRNACLYRKSRTVSKQLMGRLSRASSVDECKDVYTEIMLSSVGLTTGAGLEPAGIYLTSAQKSWKRLAEQHGHAVRVKA